MKQPWMRTTFQAAIEHFVFEVSYLPLNNVSRMAYGKLRHLF